MWFEKRKMPISEVSEFSILPYTQNRKLGNLGKCSFTSNFDSSCNLRFRNNKNELRQTFKGQDMLLEEKNKISEITSNFDSICNFFRICIFSNRVKPCFFCDFPGNFIKVSHVVQKIFRFSQSILIFSSIFGVF